MRLTVLELSEVLLRIRRLRSWLRMAILSLRCSIWWPVPRSLASISMHVELVLLHDLRMLVEYFLFVDV